MPTKACWPDRSRPGAAVPVRALAAHRGFAPQREVQDAAFPAVHGVEAERDAAALHPLGRPARSAAALRCAACGNRRRRSTAGSDPPEPSSASPSSAARAPAEARLCSREQLDIRPENFTTTSGFSKSGWRVSPSQILNLSSKPALAITWRRNSSVRDSTADNVYLLWLTLNAHPSCVSKAAGGPASGGGAGMLWFMNHCCAIPTKLLVSQYNTRPLGNAPEHVAEDQRHHQHHLGLRGVLPGVGVIFCITNCAATSEPAGREW